MIHATHTSKDKKNNVTIIIDLQCRHKPHPPPDKPQVGTPLHLVQSQFYLLNKIKIIIMQLQ